ncbi:hypothetical protein HG530_000352 [Fusarium avenaceum]|nr:hypothetical protein HG530_000352 [Fusarium avenaceum]
MDVDLRINDVDNTVGDENVGDDDLSLVDVDSAVVNLDVNLLTSSSGKSAVLEVGAVANSVVDNMVLEDAHEIRLAGVGEDGANVGKSAVAGRKDGDVLGAGEVGNQLSLGESTSSGGEVASNGSVGEVLGDGENTVDDVDDTTSEVEILDKADGTVHGHGLNTLSTSDIGVCRVGEHGRDERRSIHASDVAGIVGSVQNVVLEEPSNGAGIILDHAGNRSILEEFLEGIVAWGQDGNVPQTAKVSEETGLSGDEAWTGQ